MACNCGNSCCSNGNPRGILFPDFVANSCCNPCCNGTDTAGVSTNGTCGCNTCCGCGCTSCGS